MLIVVEYEKKLVFYNGDKMFFELQHSEKQREFAFQISNEINFPLHIHRSFEFFSQIKGKTLVAIDDKEYELTEGESVLIFPFQKHSYKSIIKGEYKIIIFSNDVVTEYSKNKANLLPTNNLFLYSAPKTIPDNPYLQKALAYNVCGNFDIGRVYKKRDSDSFSQCITKLLIYAEENYKGSCLLETATAEIGYDYAYLSKKFKRTVGIPFRKYINILRIILAKQLLAQETKTVTEIASDCGFNSLRSFNIEFKKIEGITPTEYKRKTQLNRTQATN